VSDSSPNTTERSSTQKKQHCSSSVPPQKNCDYADQGTTVQTSSSDVSRAVSNTSTNMVKLQLLEPAKNRRSPDN